MAACSICNDPVLIAALKVALGTSPGPSGAVETISGINPDANGNFVFYDGSGIMMVGFGNGLVVYGTTLVTGLTTMNPSIINNVSLNVTAFTSSALTINPIYQNLKVTYSGCIAVAVANGIPGLLQLTVTPPVGTPAVISSFQSLLNDTFTQVTAYFYVPAAQVPTGSLLTINVTHPNENVTVTSAFTAATFEVVALL